VSGGQPISAYTLAAVSAALQTRVTAPPDDSQGR